jgi:hypothetical protein
VIKSLLFASVYAASMGQAVELPKALEKVTPVGLAEQFVELCASDQLEVKRLPGEDIPLADAPFQLKFYAEGAISARIVKIGDRYAMRSQNPSRADPVHTIILRCAVTSKGQFPDEVSKLSEKLGLQPKLGKTGNGADYASYRAGLRTFNVYSEQEGWVSIFSMDILMHNIDPKYLKKGTKPVPIPPAQ